MAWSLDPGRWPGYRRIHYRIRRSLLIGSIVAWLLGAVNGGGLIVGMAGT
jgi:hypothetical protein